MNYPIQDKFSPSCNHNLSSHEVADLEYEIDYDDDEIRNELFQS